MHRQTADSDRKNSSEEFSSTSERNSCASSAVTKNDPTRLSINMNGADYVQKNLAASGRSCVPKALCVTFVKHLMYN